MPTPATVPALIPLSLLEAIRNLDTPVEDGLDELAEEIVVRRLGLSPTVAAQIQRYRQAAEKDAGVDLDEAVSVLRLVGRRADAPLAFADAGRRAARYATRVHARPTWTFTCPVQRLVGVDSTPTGTTRMWSHTSQSRQTTTTASGRRR